MDSYAWSGQTTTKGARVTTFLSAVLGVIAGGGAGWIVRGRVDIRRRSQKQTAKGNKSKQFQVGDVGGDFKK